MATAVLALQGAFAEHGRRLEELGEKVIELRGSSDLGRPFDRLVLPGGESTVQGRLLRREGMLEPLARLVEDGMPVLATCAGLILLAARIEDDVEDGFDRGDVRPARHLGTLDVTVVRNAYGRQLGSFHARGEVAGVGDDVPMTFIRAPYVAEVGPGAEGLARVDGRVVAVRQGAQLAVAFHPELDRDLRIHQAFLAL
jgi:5'-phosphate synthase pdxT subunit